MLTGTVEEFDKLKGYGFIKTDDNGERIFVHYQSIVTEGFKTLDVGQRVSFVAVEGKRGYQASLVTVID